MSKKESALYSGLNSGGCSLMGEDISPTLISRYETKTGNTQDKLNVIQKKVYDWHRQDTRMTELGDICVTAAARWGAVETICRMF